MQQCLSIGHDSDELALLTEVVESSELWKVEITSSLSFATFWDRRERSFAFSPCSKMQMRRDFGDTQVVCAFCCALRNYTLQWVMIYKFPVFNDTIG